MEKLKQSKLQSEMDIQHLEETLAQNKRQKKEYKDQLDNVCDLLQKSERERLELRKMYISISEKVLQT